MWSPTHVRRGASRPVLLLLILAGGCAIVGCASTSFKLGSPSSDDYVNRSPEHIPVPIFDVGAPSGIPGRTSPLGIVVAPKPFHWTPLGSSAGNRQIQCITAGDGGYRVLIIGSMSGNDPSAIALTEELAHYIHENGILLGGVKTTVVRTANPDGEVLHKSENANGVALSRSFPNASDDPESASAEAPEIRTLLSLLREQQPQRVIHIRTYPRERGVIAASSGAAPVARNASTWLDMEFIALPGQSREGTLERYLSEKDDCDVITFAFAAESDKSSLWESYGDTLLNLLLNEDYETRELARKRENRSSADRRNGKDDSSGAEDFDSREYRFGR